MKIKIIVFLVIIAIAAIAYHFVYTVYVPNVISRSIVNPEHEPSVFIPKKVKDRIERIKVPANNSAELLVNTMHESNITIDQVLEALENVQEETVYNFLDELNKTQIENHDQVFNMGKKHFPTEFDVEIFRKPFQEKVEIRLIKKAIRYANAFRDDESVDFELARAIVKKIIIAKEKEFNTLVDQMK